MCQKVNRLEEAHGLSHALERDSGRLGKHEEKKAQLEGHMAESCKPNPFPALSDT